MTLEATPKFITPAECSDIARGMSQKYTSNLNNRYFEVEAKKDGLGVYVKVILRNSNGSFYYPVEGRIAHVDHDLSVRDGGLLLLDYIDAYFDEYLRDGDVYLPIDWTEYECDGIPLQLKGQILNLEVEKMADDWLAGHDVGGSEGTELH